MNSKKNGFARRSQVRPPLLIRRYFYAYYDKSSDTGTPKISAILVMA